MNEKKFKITLFDIALFVNIIFLILRITGVVAWPWYILFAPLFVYFGLVLLALIFVLQAFLIIALIQARDDMM